MKLTNDFIIVIPVWNAEHFIIDALLSVFHQDYTNLGVIIRDDMSTDNTPQIIERVLGIDGKKNTHTKHKGKDVIYVQNDKKLYGGGNTFESVRSYVENPEAIIGVVDGDDRLLTQDAVSRVKKHYDEMDIWMLWTQHKSTSGRDGKSCPIPENYLDLNREYWSVDHFRTSKAWLFNKINRYDMIFPLTNEYYPVCGDAAFLFPTIEMVGIERSYFLDEELYLYRDNITTNDMYVDLLGSRKYAKFIRHNGTRYYKL